jgi:Fe-S cluster biogenesis protein NfuA
MIQPFLRFYPGPVLERAEAVVKFRFQPFLRFYISLAAVIALLSAQGACAQCGVVYYTATKISTLLEILRKAERKTAERRHIISTLLEILPLMCSVLVSF